MTDVLSDSLGAQTAMWEAEEREFLTTRALVPATATASFGQTEDLGAHSEEPPPLTPMRRGLLQHAQRHASRQREVWQKQLEAKQLEAALRPRQLSKSEGARPQRSSTHISPENREVCAKLGLAYADARLFFVEGGSVQRRCSPPSAGSRSTPCSAATPQSGLRIPRQASARRPRSASSRTATVTQGGQAVSTPRPWR